ncbi:CPBP family glutamic-type intramembrane protease [Xanthomonas fragariae]|uniref:CPBP family glutamic-type intramembrane protease n=1 Tax=Xanthomonas fragariae TaxID=48664 RepID=UPI0022AA7136|nr:CPBP family glutamic-type intramembrane protease [Xanthomonas fragariae]WAT14452.1 CPBP family glutamic-type intramembrane protease [Xanthomonas fragariae]
MDFLSRRILISSFFIFSCCIAFFIILIHKEFSENKILDFFLYVFCGPFLETIIYQFLIQEVGLRFKWDKKFSIAFSWVAFLLAHTGGVVRMVIPGLLGGGVLAVTYGLSRKYGRGYAFVITFMVHAAWNSCVILFLS